MRVFLTIDDAPSDFFRAKIDALKAHKIPAVLFCVGKSMHGDKLTDIVYAINQGFIIGNHSYSHPWFSKCENCIEQIKMTEDLIEEAYKLAGVARPCKLFRYPFGDMGSHDVQEYLEQNGFESIAALIGQEIHNCKNDMIERGTDSGWSFDIGEYYQMISNKNDEFNFNDMNEVFTRLVDYCAEHSASETINIMLLHDFNKTHNETFDPILKILVDSGLEFLDLMDYLPKPSSREKLSSSFKIT